MVIRTAATSGSGVKIFGNSPMRQTALHHGCVSLKMLRKGYPVLAVDENLGREGWE